MILSSVAHTHRAVIIEEAWKSAGFAAEVSARIMEGAFDALDAPVARVCGAEVPMPYAQALEEAALPQPETIVKAVQGCSSHGGVPHAAAGRRYDCR